MEILTSNTSLEEKMNIYRKILGQGLNGKIDYSAANDNEIIRSAKRERVKEEMIAYMTQCLKEEFDEDDEGQALLKWEKYKIKHNIKIKEYSSDE